MEEVFKNLESLEVEIAESSSRSDANRLNELLADEFQEFGRSGKTYGKQEIIAMLSNENPCEIKCRKFKFTALSSSAVLITYISNSSGEDTNRSSVWIKNGHQWQLLHHQGTSR